MKRHLLILGLLAFGASLVLAAAHSWWASEPTRILSADSSDNYAPANLGQLKLVAKKAMEYLDLYLPGGAGPDIAQMVASFEPRQGQGYTPQQISQFKAANYAPANLGQLKAVAKPFYDRLLDAGYDTRQNLISRGYPSSWAFDYPWNPATPTSENYVPANLGQLKMTFSFDISTDSDGDGLTDLQEASVGTDPHASDAPINLTAQGQWAGIDLAWQAGSASAAESFLIERRESMDTAGPFTPWQELDWVPGTSQEYHDFWLEHGEYVIYRVRAVFGTGENQWRSAPSNLARAVRWIDLGGGLYGPPPGGDDGTGGVPGDPPGGDPPDDSGGGDDPVIDGDGDGDGDPDNDDDGVVDIFDRYPNDPKRNEDIPFKFYAVLNPNPDGTFQPTAEDPALGTTIQLNINDSSDFAWGGLEKTPDHGDDGGEIWEYRSAWKQGASAGQETAVRLYERQGNAIRYSQLYPIGAGVPNTEGSHGIFAGNVSVSRLVLTVDGWVSPDTQSESGRYTIEQGVIQYDLVSAGYGDWISKSYLGVSQYGKPFGLDRFATGTDSSRRYHQRASIAGVNIPALASTSITEGDVPNLTLKAMSPTGISVVQRHVAGDPPSMYLCQPDGSAGVVPLPLDVFAINDQRQVVGQLDASFPNADPTRGTLGFLWSPTGGLKVFHDLLPKKFRKQLRSAVPFLITNKAIDGSTQISFTADLLIDTDSPGGPATDWKSESFILTIYADPGKKPTVTHSALNNAGIPVDCKEVSVNKNGIGAGKTIFQEDVDPNNNGRTKPCLKNPLEFFANNILLTGFDLPMWNDLDGKLNGATSPEPELAGKRDQDPPDDAWPGPQWWTSMPYLGSDGRPNANIEVYTGASAKLWARVIDPGALNGSDVVRLVTPGQDTSFGLPQKWQTLTIDTNSRYPTAATAARVVGRIGVFSTPPSAATQQLLQVLRVDAMPVWKIRLRFYEVYAQNEEIERIPADFKDVTAIITHLNKIYRQACITFVADPVEELPVPYDTSPADHKVSLVNGSISVEQTLLFDKTLPQLNAINVFLLREFSSSKTLGFSQRSQWDDRCAVQTKPFENPRVLLFFWNTIAHEIGHLLNMSVHDSRNLIGAGADGMIGDGSPNTTI